jgi:aminopeptidase N
MIARVLRLIIGSAALVLTNVAVGTAQPAAAAAASVEAGVPQTLAVERAQRISDLTYRIAFDIPADRSASITGRLTATFVLKDTASPLVFDFEPNARGALRQVSAGGSRLTLSVVNGHIVIPPPALRVGSNLVTIDFDAGDAPLNRNDDFLYTIFVPARAHEAFPCFDQPDLKARWRLELTVPDGWASVANGAEASRLARDGRTRFTFEETAPMSTYLFAFAAGQFSEERAERNGRTFRMLHRETDAAKVARNRDAIFDLHAAALRWLEEYTAIPYPFGKFDFVLVPAFQFGGMEHPGAVFYNASGLMLDESATQNQRLERASTISHETAHMWFGDLVTMRWFTDVWMKEVFANFMAAKIVNPSFPGINHELRFLHAYYPAAYDIDRTAGTNAIRQPLDNLKDAGTLYGNIIYDKAPIVMRQLELIVGAEPFRQGLQQYLRDHQFGNASWPDLISVLDARTPEDLESWSRAWVEERGRPIVETQVTTADGRLTGLSFAVRDPYPRRGLTWSERMQVALGYPDRVQLLPVTLLGNRTEVAGLGDRPAPLFVLPNGAGLAYGEFHLDAASRDWLASHLPEVTDPLTRGSAWITLWDALLDGDLTADRLIDLAVAALPRESDELNVQGILSYLQQAYWKFSPDDRRRASAGRLEQTLREGLAAAGSQSLKSAYFSALRNIATTPDTVAWLTRIWSGTDSIPGLTLAEPDFIVLAEELAVREVADWRALLDRQVARTENPDRKARLQFVVPALSADPAERARWFQSLSDVANRRREPWVLDGLRFLHHPLRATESEPYIRPSLDLLAEIQRTGDIFFPVRWTDATLGGHRSSESARIVRTFLEQAPPAYPDRLRRIILASADDLFRATSPQ